jgi:hypothetical protein
VELGPESSKRATWADAKDECSAVASAAVDELRRHGDPWKLEEELPKAEVHSTPEKLPAERMKAGCGTLSDPIRFVGCWQLGDWADGCGRVPP